jgi:drug/metabolite transporter (DMT)-like permease
MIRRGVVLATLAAIAFGATAPLVKRAGAGLGPFATAALLYLGAALISLPALGRWRAAGPRRADAPWLVVVALAGAAAAPALLAWGLARTSAVTASLMLNVEAIASVALAALVYREHLGRRVIGAAALMTVAGLMLVLAERRGGGDAATSTIGALAVLGAALAWAIDNTATRRLADRDATTIVLAKAGLGAALTLAAALARGEARSTPGAALALAALGASGYGLSLRLYLAAQRALGAARTASIFAIGPFVGAALAPLLGEPWPGAAALAAGALFATGVMLHLTESHGHRHVHEAVVHEHVHRHDDGHHDHAHDPPVAGEHSHAHAHERVEHEHPHAPDVHHTHTH